MINFLLTYSETQKWCSLLINDNDDDDYDLFCPYTVASYLQNTAGFPSTKYINSHLSIFWCQFVRVYRSISVHKGAVCMVILQVQY